MRQVRECNQFYGERPGPFEELDQYWVEKILNDGTERLASNHLEAKVDRLIATTSILIATLGKKGLLTEQEIIDMVARESAYAYELSELPGFGQS